MLIHVFMLHKIDRLACEDKNKWPRRFILGSLFLNKMMHFELLRDNEQFMHIYWSINATHKRHMGRRCSIRMTYITVLGPMRWTPSPCIAY
jgi:hypothetical protein